MIKVMIIDDEQHCINRLAALLSDGYEWNFEVVGVYHAVSTALKGAALHDPDLIFLDIQLEDGTGFDFLRQLPDRRAEVIFTTAFDSHATQAFRFSALDYLMKPVNREELEQAVHKLQIKNGSSNFGKRIENLFHNFNALVPEEKRLCIPLGNEIIFIRIKDIVRLESDVNYSILHLSDKRKLVVAKTLKEFEKMLSSLNFFRVHNSHLINLSYLKSYHKGKGGQVVLDDNTIIDVSTRKKEEFLKRISLM